MSDGFDAAADARRVAASILDATQLGTRGEQVESLANDLLDFAEEVFESRALASVDALRDVINEAVRDAYGIGTSDGVAHDRGAVRGFDGSGQQLDALVEKVLAHVVATFTPKDGAELRAKVEELAGEIYEVGHAHGGNVMRISNPLRADEGWFRYFEEIMSLFAAVAARRREGTDAPR